ncbi:OsmC family protein [Thermococcus paralvinellae]|nr:OsmC family protein [Thermococcus paralvinellae]
MSVNLIVDTEVDEKTLEEWIKHVEERCPVSDTIANPTPVKIEVQKA